MTAERSVEAVAPADVRTPGPQEGAAVVPAYGFPPLTTTAAAVLSLQRCAGNQATMAALRGQPRPSPVRAAGRRSVSRQIVGLEEYTLPDDPTPIPDAWVDAYLADIRLDVQAHLSQLEIELYLDQTDVSWRREARLQHHRNHWEVSLLNASGEVVAVVETPRDGNCGVHAIAAILQRNALMPREVGGPRPYGSEPIGRGPRSLRGPHAERFLTDDVRRFATEHLGDHRDEVEQRIALEIGRSRSVAETGFGQTLQAAILGELLGQATQVRGSESSASSSSRSEPRNPVDAGFDEDAMNASLMDLVDETSPVQPGPGRQRPSTVFGFGVQAHLARGPGGRPVVESIDIGGRPHGLFGSKHGSHITAWVVFCDVVRTAVVNQPIPAAILRLIQLIGEAPELPGASSDRLAAMEDDVQVTGKSARTGRDIYDEALEAAAAAQAFATQVWADPGLALPALQELAAAYLTLRNATPLSVTHDVAVAQGHGEGGARGDLQAAEQANNEREQARQELEAAELGQDTIADTKVRELLWKLLDARAVNFLVRTEPAIETPRANSPVPGNVPGETRARRLAETVAQHLLTIRRAYPALYRRADMDGEDSLRSLLGDEADVLVGEYDGVSVGAAIQEKLGRPFEPMGSAASRVAPGRHGVVQIVVGSDDRGRPCVATLRIGSRPTGILGAEEGAHLSAFGLVVEGLVRVMRNCPLDEVADRIRDQLDQASRLPTAKRNDALVGDSASLYKEARDDATAALENAEKVQPTDEDFVSVLQELLVAYLLYRNTLPLTATAEGGVPGGKAEAPALATLRRAESAYRRGDVTDSEDQEACQAAPGAMWALLDSSALSAVAWSASKTRAPGIRRDDEERDKAKRRRTMDDEHDKRIGDVVGTHVSTAENAFPECAREHDFAGKESILHYLVHGPLNLRRVNARRVAEYVETGELPPARADRMDVEPSQQQPKRSGRASEKRKREDEYDEADFEHLERQEEEEAGQIERPPRPAKRRRLNDAPPPPAIVGLTEPHDESDDAMVDGTSREPEDELGFDQASGDWELDERR